MKRSNRLLLSFTGLCWFAPKYRIEDDAHRESNAMTVLLAESTKPPPRSRLHSHEPHLPVLVTPAAGVVSEGSFREPDACFCLKDGTDWAVFFLDDQDVSVVSAGKEPCLTVLYSPNSGSGCPTVETYDSFGWVGPLALMTPGSEVLEDDCVGEGVGSYKPVNQDVVARVTLTEGIIGTWSLAADRTRRVIEWRTQRLVRGHSHALADSVMCLANINSDPAAVEFETTLFTGRHILDPRVACVFKNTAQRRIRLRPDENCFIHAMVKNMPWLDISAQRKPEDHGETDIHFAHIYKLSRNPRRSNVPRRRRPCERLYPRGDESIFWELRRKLGDLGFFHQGRPTCPPAQGSAVG